MNVLAVAHSVGGDMQFLDITNIFALITVEISFPAATVWLVFLAFLMILGHLALTWLIHRISERTATLRDCQDTTGWRFRGISSGKLRSPL